MAIPCVVADDNGKSTPAVDLTDSITGRFGGFPIGCGLVVKLRKCLAFIG
jgi:hypothetical protein